MSTGTSKDGCSCTEPASALKSSDKSSHTPRPSTHCTSGTPYNHKHTGSSSPLVHNHGATHRHSHRAGQRTLSHKLDNNDTPTGQPSSVCNGGIGSIHLPKLCDSAKPISRGDKRMEARPTVDLSVCGTLESLRWEHQLSDEEAEKVRLEVYKSNRRKRYQAVLDQHHTPVLITRLTTRTDRYS